MDEQELIKRYGIDIEALEKEQIKLSKTLEIKDIVDFSLVTTFGAIENITVGNQILSVIIICDKEFNIIEQQYFLDKLRFPYLHEYRSYREVPVMIEAFNKLNEKPDVVFIHAHGIMHPRLGLASHFSILTGVPSIGVAGDLFKQNELSSNGQDILLKKKKVGKVLVSKEKANPLYVSPGNLISIETAYNLTKELLKHPHKLPEPLHLAHKYIRSVKEELKLV